MEAHVFKKCILSSMEAQPGKRADFRTLLLYLTKHYGWFTSTCLYRALSELINDNHLSLQIDNETGIRYYFIGKNNVNLEGYVSVRTVEDELNRRRNVFDKLWSSFSKLFSF